MRLGRLVLLVVLALCASLLTARAQAQEAKPASGSERARAAELTARATSAFRAQRYETAAQLFERAYAVVPAVELQFNLGQCYRQLHRDPEARAAFARYLRARPDAPERAEIERWMRESDADIALDTATSRNAPLQPAAQRELASEAGQSPAFTAGTMPPRRDDGGPTIFERWWFWTALGVAAAGGVTAALVLDHEGGGSPPGGTLGTVRWD